MDTGSIGTERNKAVVAEFDQLIGSDDLSPLDRLCRPDMVNHALAPDRPSGLAGTREFLETMGRHQMTDGGLSRLVVVAEDDYVVQVGARHGRWHGGSFLGINAPPGTTIATLPPCTGSSRARSLSGGRSATTSGCFDNSVPSPVADRRR
jgi:hypothetical protein